MRHETSRRMSRALVVFGAVAALALPALGYGSRAQAATASPDCGRNLLANGGFERADRSSAQPSGWTTNAWAPTAVFTVTANSGERNYLVIAARLGFWSGVTSGTAWFDDVTRTPLT